MTDHLAPTMLGGLSHEGVQVANCRWVSKVVTTDPPRYTPHTEFRWTCELIGDVPLLVALLVWNDRGVRWSRAGRSSADTRPEIDLSFLPYGWADSDEVRISLSVQGHGYAATQSCLEDARLKQDPRDLVTVNLADGNSLLTGTVIGLGAVASRNRLSLGMVLLAQSDTESCRAGRWRIKRRIPVELPAPLNFLANGRRAGFSPFGPRVNEAPTT